jgi:hypothetical protein
MKKLLLLLTLFSTIGLGVDKTIIAPTGAVNIKANTTAKIQTYNTGAWQDRLTVLNNGKVGIGTSSPLLTLDVTHDVAGDWIAQFKNYSVASFGLKIDLSGSTVDFTTYALAIYTGSGTGMYFLNNGKMGIGRSNPSVELDIVGKMAVSTSGGTGPNSGYRAELQAKGGQISAGGTELITAPGADFQGILSVNGSKAGNGNISTGKFFLIYHPGNSINSIQSLGSDVNGSSGAHPYTVTSSAGSATITITNSDGSNAMDFTYFLTAMPNQ